MPAIEVHGIPSASTSIELIPSCESIREHRQGTKTINVVTPLALTQKKRGRLKSISTPP